MSSRIVLAFWIGSAGNSRLSSRPSNSTARSASVLTVRLMPITPPTPVRKKP